MSAALPATKAARHALIRQLVQAGNIKSQSQLVAELGEQGLEVAQATLSRDLGELRVDKVYLPDGTKVYMLPGSEVNPETVGKTQEMLAAGLSRLLAKFLLRAEGSGNIALLRTPPGAAHLLAAAIDQSVLPGMMGSVAGDDTILVLSREAGGGSKLADRFTQLAGEGEGS
ncbi:MAG: arginine repressor [Bifidobacteriaceae bacterium]|jgi:transcriptional regulator of arginine metabolism|nr:arginine repressor [Bifidobacteriaceae bacterium]